MLDLVDWVLISKRVCAHCFLMFISDELSSDILSNASKTRSTGCPTCKKPLPHCALCLLPLSCAPPTLNTRSVPKVVDSGNRFAILDEKIEKDIDDGKPSFPFEQWFAWCQECRHGGHSLHMKSWFQDHAECPVTDCKCICSKHVAHTLADENSL